MFTEEDWETLHFVDHHGYRYVARDASHELHAFINLPKKNAERQTYTVDKDSGGGCLTLYPRNLQDITYPQGCLRVSVLLQCEQSDKLKYTRDKVLQTLLSAIVPNSTEVTLLCRDFARLIKGHYLPLSAEDETKTNLDRVLSEDTVPVILDNRPYDFAQLGRLRKKYK